MNLRPDPTPGLTGGAEALLGWRLLTILTGLVGLVFYLQGRKRFGPPDAVIRKALKAITDVARLEQLSERLLEVASWQELLDLPRPRRGHGRQAKGLKGSS